MDRTIVHSRGLEFGESVQPEPGCTDMAETSEYLPKTLRDEFARAMLENSPWWQRQRRAVTLINYAMTQVQNQGNVLVHPNIHPICDRLKHRDPSSGDGWRYRQRPTLEHRTEPPKVQMRSRRTEKMTKDCEGCYHPLIQRVESNESLPRAVGLRLNEPVFQRPPFASCWPEYLLLWICPEDMDEISDTSCRPGGSFHNFNVSKMYPGHVWHYARTDGKIFQLLNAKCKLEFISKRYITTFISEQIKFQGDEDTLLETNEGQVTSSSNVEHEEFSSQVLGDMLGLEEMGRRQGKNSSNNLKSNMKTPDPNDLTKEGLEPLNPEEVEKSAIMKAIESLKQDMNNSLKELDEKYNKKIEEMSKEMDEKYNKKFEEMSKSVNDTLGNQEKTIKQVMETVQELKTEMEAMKKTQNEGQLDIENLVLEVLAIAIRQHKGIKEIRIGKDEVKLSLFADDMIMYISDPKNSTKECLQLINTFRNVAGYKINSKKSVALLYTKDKEAEREIRKTSPFMIATNSIKYLGVTLTKEVKDLFDKNFKSLRKEIEEDTRKWKDLPCSWIGRINIVKTLIYIYCESMIDCHQEYEEHYKKHKISDRKSVDSDYNHNFKYMKQIISETMNILVLIVCFGGDIQRLSAQDDLEFTQYTDKCQHCRSRKVSIQTDQDPRKTVHANRSRPSAIVNGFSVSPHFSHIQRIRFDHMLIQSQFSWPWCALIRSVPLYQWVNAPFAVLTSFFMFSFLLLFIWTLEAQSSAPIPGSMQLHLGDFMMDPTVRNYICYAGSVRKRLLILVRATETGQKEGVPKGKKQQKKKEKRDNEDILCDSEKTIVHSRGPEFGKVRAWIGLGIPYGCEAATVSGIHLMALSLGNVPSSLEEALEKSTTGVSHQQHLSFSEKINLQIDNSQEAPGVEGQMAGKVVLKKQTQQHKVTQSGIGENGDSSVREKSCKDTRKVKKCVNLRE
ncbi:hypothetical protein U0070_003248 [Myodes glareolus]|uniref:RNA-directed DNA polymerase n=1 Tax=Myodes glareolus TaxID=447135 RepID=A0AAW0HYZ1_MYOGA